MDSCGRRLWSGDLQVIAELTKLFGEGFGAIDQRLGVQAVALFDVMNAFVQDLPNKPAEAVSDGPYGGLVAESRQEAPKDGLEMCALASGRSVSCLAEEASQVSVAFG